MKNFFKKVGNFFKTNYWLPPLLLVAVVFIVVFSLEGLEGAVETIKGWFDENSKCSQCKSVKASDCKSALEGLSGDEKVYVYFFDKEENKDDTLAANELLNGYLKEYKDINGKNSIKVYTVNIGAEERSEKDNDVVTEWADSSMDAEFLAKLAEQVRIYYANSEAYATVQGIQEGEYTINGPILIALQANQDKSVNTSNFVATSVIDEVDNFSASKLDKFFKGTYNPAE